MKKNTNILPNNRRKNHKIELFKGKQAFFVQNYKLLFKQETKAIKKYINEYFGKGFIRPNLLAAAAPMLLIKKLGGRLRFCVNYRAPNEITMKNWYPILLINKMLGKLSNTACFTKFDIIYVFNKN